jgi:hypothetical protein
MTIFAVFTTTTKKLNINFFCIHVSIFERNKTFFYFILFLCCVVCCCGFFCWYVFSLFLLCDRLVSVKSEKFCIEPRVVWSYYVEFLHFCRQHTIQHNTILNIQKRCVAFVCVFSFRFYTLYLFHSFSFVPFFFIHFIRIILYHSFYFFSFVSSFFIRFHVFILFHFFSLCH